MAARRDRVERRPSPSPYRQEQDEWDRQLWKATGLAIGRWLLDANINLSRPIASLTGAELTGMSWAAIASYHKLRQQRASEPGPPPSDTLA